jgi:hypothetical protein
MGDEQAERNGAHTADAEQRAAWLMSVTARERAKAGLFTSASNFIANAASA